jgi:toxin ParE1/3/4
VKTKPTVIGDLAKRDSREAVRYYLENGGPEVASSFSASLRSALRHIRQHPGIGSPHYANSLGLPGLRHWHLRTFPHLIFYFEDDHLIDIWRILHGQRDIAASLQVPD